MARVEGELERVRAVRRPGQVGPRLALVERDRDEAEARTDLGDLRVDLAAFGVERAVHRVQDRCLDDPAERCRGKPGVVVDDVELVRTLVARERVLELGQRLADPCARRVMEEARWHGEPL